MQIINHYLMWHSLNLLNVLRIMSQDLTYNLLVTANTLQHTKIL